MTRNAIEELEARGLLEQVTHRDELATKTADGQITAYCGFDPTATSLHIGNLLPVMMLAHMQRAGHRVIAVVGGATGRIGDPSGRDDERQLLSNEQIEANCAAIRAQLATYLQFDGPNPATLVNNLDWIGPFSFIDWLRDVGKHFTVNQMIAKESVKRRLEAREQGITYTEFSYQMLQAYDFVHLKRTMGCDLQVGGNDQWGNITAGCDLAHKTLGARVYALTCPLMTTATGEKLGKSSGNSVWLDASLTSPYEFYQYWFQTDDRDVDRWLRVFTFLSIEEIEAMVAEHAEAPARRTAQRALAAEITRIVHGEAGLQSALRASRVLFGEAIEGLSDAELASIFKDVPSSDRSRAELAAEIRVVDLLATTVCSSASEARRLIAQGGAYVNNRRVDDDTATVGIADLGETSCLVLRSGKKKYHVCWFRG
ncbi:MAG: tyrosine--tRNA ligase [Myxococcales bacterium]|nr:tyrosine--tRNA ligase [Myxococcales bacterium]MCB9530872.1 tyrosine--tRNA ligase [Myxococcales bacterium]MCB9534328.1 tyrosine--tRNA ligase [Myxococcales bacterium]